MPAPSLSIPLSVKDETEEGLSRKIALIQAREGGRIGIITIAWKTTTKEWVCWYRPIGDSHLGSIGGAG